MAWKNELHINIDDMVRKKIARIALKSTSSLTPTFERKKKERFPPLPYLSPLTDSLAAILRTSKIKPVYYPHLQIGRLLSNGKDTIPPSSNAMFTS